MKRVFTFLSAIIITASVFAQFPEKMSYQALIRNSNNNLLTNQTVGMQISIIQGSANGTAVYVETQKPTSNAEGLVSIEIGNGTVVSGDFSAIDWSLGLYFITIETDPSGGTAYSITGTSQLLSVPYALHAKTAESISTSAGTKATETDPIFSASAASEITQSDITNWNNKLDSDEFNESTATTYLSVDRNAYKYSVDNCGHLIKNKVNASAAEQIVERAEFIVNTLTNTKYEHSLDSLRNECEGIYHYDCSGFICEFVYKKCLPNHYQDLHNHATSTRPLSEDFYNYFRGILGDNYDSSDTSTCVAENEYWRVFTNFEDIQKGDLICARYSEGWRIAEGSTNTGHVMMAWSAAVSTDTANLYNIEILDSSSSSHSNDSRDATNPSVSSDGTGIGHGWMTFKTSTTASNRPIQYLWTLTSTLFYRSFASYYDANDPEDERSHDRLAGIIIARPK